MSVQIIIDGKHSTDVLAELKVLSDALNEPKQLELPLEAPVKTDESSAQAMGESISEAKEQVKETGEAVIISTSEPKKLSRGEHKAEADKMIAAGKKDEEIFPLLSRGQQKRVEESLAAPIEVVVDNAPKEEDNSIEVGGEAPAVASIKEEKQEEVDNLFDDEPEEKSVQKVTIEDLRGLIVKKCKDENGKDIPEMYAAVRAEIKNAVPKDKDPKISEVPEEKYEELYNSLNSLGK